MVVAGALIGSNATPIRRFVAPARAVFQSVVSLGLMPSMSAVKLLSKPQQVHALATNAAETTPGHPLPQDNAVPAAITPPTPSHPRVPNVSPNTRAPSSAVAATSKFNNNDTEPADAERSPNSSSTGPAMPPSRTAPASRRRVMASSGGRSPRRHRARGAMPMAAPR